MLSTRINDINAFIEQKMGQVKSCYIAFHHDRTHPLNALLKLYCILN